MIGTIAWREIKSLFLSPLAWTILAVVQLILGYLFLTQTDRFLALQPRLAGMEGAPGVSDLVVAPLLGNAGVIMLLVMPLITMRLVSEEHRGGTLPLLFSAPVSMSEIVLGKYLGVVLFVLIMVGMLALMPLSLLTGTDLDMGKLAAGLLALVLLLASFAAVGLFVSTLTEQPTVAAMATFGVLLLLWILDWAGGTQQLGSGVVGYLSLLNHYQNLLKGLFSSSDIAYYGLFILAFLGLSIRRLDSERLQS